MKSKLNVTWTMVWQSALRFLFSVGCSLVFPMIFEMENVLLSVALFVGLITMPQYSMTAILLMGYLSFFTSDYKHKSVVNAICAINAALVLMDTASAIQNRMLCLALGIVIVVILWAIQHAVTTFRNRFTPSDQKVHSS